MSGEAGVVGWCRVSLFRRSGAALLGGLRGAEDLGVERQEGVEEAVGEVFGADLAFGGAEVLLVDAVDVVAEFVEEDVEEGVGAGLGGEK